MISTVACTIGLTACGRKEKHREMQTFETGSPWDHQGIAVPAHPTARAEWLEQLPLHERRVGKGLNSALLGELNLANAEVSVDERNETVKFHARGTARGKSVDIELFGKVDEIGSAILLPTFREPEEIKIRGRATCLDFDTSAFSCGSLFVDVYVKMGDTILTEQVTVDTTEADAPRATIPAAHRHDRTETRPEARPDLSTKRPPEKTPEAQQKTTQKPSNSSADAPAAAPDSANALDIHEQTAPAPAPAPSAPTQNETPQESEADSSGAAEGSEIADASPVTDDEEDEGDEGSDEAPENPARYVGFPDEVEELFEREPPPAWQDPSTTSPLKVKPSEADNKDKPQRPADTAKTTPAFSPKPAPMPPAVPPPQTKPPEKTPAKPADAGKPDKQTGRREKPSTPSAQRAPKAPATLDKEDPPNSHATSERPEANDRTPVKVANQAIGRYNAGALANASSLELSNPFYLILHPERKTHFGTHLLIEVIERIAKAAASLIPNYRLTVGDIARAKGGRLGGHKSHQNGLDADLGYLVNRKNSGRFIGIATTNGITDTVYKEEQWTIFKRVVSSGVVSQIFVNVQVKRAFCQYAKEIDEYDSGLQTLRRLSIWPKHHDHWHLRLKCPTNNPRCRDNEDPANSQNCPTVRTTSKKK